MKTQRCSKCKRIKSLKDFFKDRAMQSGLKSACKVCCNTYRKQNSKEKRKTNLIAQLARTNKNRSKVNKATRIRYHNNREINLIRSKVGHAVRTGLIDRQPCCMCGDLKTEAHHYDYSKPFELVWLCRVHHSRLHGAIKRGKRVSDEYDKLQGGG